MITNHHWAPHTSSMRNAAVSTRPIDTHEQMPFGLVCSYVYSVASLISWIPFNPPLGRHFEWWHIRLCVHFEVSLSLSVQHSPLPKQFEIYWEFIKIMQLLFPWAFQFDFYLCSQLENESEKIAALLLLISGLYAFNNSHASLPHTLPLCTSSAPFVGPSHLTFINVVSLSRLSYISFIGRTLQRAQQWSQSLTGQNRVGKSLFTSRFLIKLKFACFFHLMGYTNYCEWQSIWIDLTAWLFPLKFVKTSDVKWQHKHICRIYLAFEERGRIALMGTVKERCSSSQDKRCWESLACQSTHRVSISRNVRFALL